MLTTLQALNPGISLLSVTDPAFHRYGRTLQDVQCDTAIQAARNMWTLENKADFSISVPAFEQDMDLKKTLTDRIYAEMPAAVGWVYGKNNRLNALEFHQGSEVHIPLEDVIFLVAHYEDIEWTPNPRLNTATVKAFFAEKGTVTELYTWCLHLVPIQAHEHLGFCNLFTLPRGTGAPLSLPRPQTPDGRIMAGRNKWLIAHPEAEDLIQAGHYPGLYGPNLIIQSMA